MLVLYAKRWELLYSMKRQASIREVSNDDHFTAEQEQVLREAINSGLAQTPDEALDQALDMLRDRLPRQNCGSGIDGGDCEASGAFWQKPRTIARWCHDQGTAP